MFTESSKPMIAKNARAAPLTTSENGSPPALNSSARAGSPMPCERAHAPTRMTISRPGELDAGHRYVELHGLADTAKIDVREPENEQRHEHDERHRRELLEVARERAARRRHRSQRRAHDGETDEKRHETAIERALRVQRGTGRARILADELEIRSSGEQSDDESAAEREPRCTADAPGDVASERIDARAEHVADHEEQQELRPDDPVEPRAVHRGRIGH
jgi:hypothetical protein